MKYPNLRAEMARRGYTVETFGEIIGLKSGATSLKLNGKRDFDIVEIKKICEHFNMSFEVLFCESTN